MSISADARTSYVGTVPTFNTFRVRVGGTDPDPRVRILLMFAARYRTKIILTINLRIFFNKNKNKLSSFGTYGTYCTLEACV